MDSTDLQSVDAQKIKFQLTNLQNMPVSYFWFGKVVPEDYLISLSELTYPIIFQKNPKIQRNFSRQLLDVEKSDYYRLWYLYEHGGIYSDFDNTIDYPCLINLLKSYKNQDKLVFMTDGKHTRQKTKQITNNLIYAPYPKMPILKKMLDSIDEKKQRVWGFFGLKFLGSIQEPLEVNMDKYVKHENDWSWFKASNEVLGANRNPRKSFLSKLEKKKDIKVQKNLLKYQLELYKQKVMQLQQLNVTKNLVFQLKISNLQKQNETLSIEKTVCRIQLYIILVLLSIIAIYLLMQSLRSSLSKLKKVQTFDDSIIYEE